MEKTVGYYWDLKQKINTFTKTRWGVGDLVNLWSERKPHYMKFDPYNIPKYKEIINRCKIENVTINKELIIKLDSWVLDVLLYKFPMLAGEIFIIQHEDLLKNNMLGNISVHNFHNGITILRNAYLYEFPTEKL